MVLAPESELVAQVTTPEQKADVDAYLERTKKRTERERISDRSVTGVFSGSYAVNPFTGEAVPIWISDYVLAGYGTGAIMAVPAHDSRDYAFAKHFNPVSYTHLVPLTRIPFCCSIVSLSEYGVSAYNGNTYTPQNKEPTSSVFFKFIVITFIGY